MTPREGLAFFQFFELVTPDSGPAWNDSARKLPLVARRCGVPFFPCCLVKKWCVADPKMIFAKNQEVYFLALKCKTTPVPTKSAGTCAKFKKYLQRLPHKTRADIRIPGCLLFMWGVFPSFWFRVSVGASQKTLFQNSKNGKRHFSWDKTKIGICGVPRHPKGHVCVLYGPVLTNYAMLMAESWSFNLKVMQTRTW
jgi:hypothetical protein